MQISSKSRIDLQTDRMIGKRSLMVIFPLFMKSAYGFLTPQLSPTSGWISYTKTIEKNIFIIQHQCRRNILIFALNSEKKENNGYTNNFDEYDDYTPQEEDNFDMSFDDSVLLEMNNDYTGMPFMDDIDTEKPKPINTRNSAELQHRHGGAQTEPQSSFRTEYELSPPPYEYGDESLEMLEEEEFSSQQESGQNKNLIGKYEEMTSIIIKDLNPSQIKATTSPYHSITRVIAGPGAGKTRVLTSRIAWLLLQSQTQSSSWNDNNNNSINNYDRILAVTFTKKAAGEMEHRLNNLLHDAADSVITQQTKNENSNYDDSENDTSMMNSTEINDSLMRRVTVGTFHSVCAKILRYNGVSLKELKFPPKLSSFNKNKRVLLDGSFIIINQSEQIRIVKECLKETGINLGDTKQQNRMQKGAIKPNQILDAITKLKHADHLSLHSSTSEDNSETNTGNINRRVLEIAEQIYVLYHSKLYFQNSFDFDDLILWTLLLLKQNPDSIRDTIQKRYNHILVDEFQDTSKTQFELVKLWTTQSLMIVGDSDQSIYSWRGAHGMESMRDVEKAYDCNDGKNSEKKQYFFQTVYLMENYRSTSKIVHAAQQVINSDSSSSSSYLMIEENKSDSDDIPYQRQNMIPMRGNDGPSPRILSCYNSKAEAKFVTQTILQKIQEYQQFLYNRQEPPTIAIIYRTNAQSRIIEEECVHQNVPYVLRGSSAGTFYNRAEIKDCLCFLKLIYHKGRDREALIRTFQTPSKGIGNKATQEFLDYFDHCLSVSSSEDTSSAKTIVTPLDVLISLASYQKTDKKKTKKKKEDTDQIFENVNDDKKELGPEDFMTKRSLNVFIPFAEQIQKIDEKSYTETVSELLNSILTMFDLSKHFDSISNSASEFKDRMSNVMELCNAAERYQSHGPASSFTQEEEQQQNNNDEDGLSPLGNFLDDVALLTDLSVDKNTNEEEGTNGSNNSHRRIVANLMTIHASKGMEFDIVFLIGNEDGTFPTQRSITNEDESLLEEEKRLCYVAMTRAKTYLYMTWRKEVMMTFFDSGGGFRTMDMRRSRFLDTLIQAKEDSKMKKKKKKKKRKKTESIPSIEEDNAFPFNSHQIQAQEYERGDILNHDSVSDNNIDFRTPSSLKKKKKKKKKKKARTLKNDNTLPQSPQGNSWEDWDPISYQSSPTSIIPDSQSQSSIISTSFPPPSSPSPSFSPSINNRKRVDSPRDSREIVFSHRERADVKKKPTIDSSNQRNNENSKNRHKLDSRRRTNDFQATTRSTENRYSKKNETPTRGRTSSFRPPAEIEFDSTLIFPIGCKVEHRIHGIGKVVEQQAAKEKNSFDNTDATLSSKPKKSASSLLMGFEMGRMSSSVSSNRTTKSENKKIPKVRVQFMNDENVRGGFHVDFPMNGSGLRRLD